MSTLKGGARKTEWFCSVMNESGQKKPMYINTRTQEKYPIFINKKGNLSYRNNKGLVKPVLNCNSEDVIKIFRLYRNPTTKKKTTSVHRTANSNKTKKQNQNSVKELIDKIKKGEPLPKTNSVKHLMHFCKLATEKNAFANQTSPVRAKTPSPVRAKTPSPVRAKTPSPVRAKTPSPVRAKTPSPVRASTIQKQRCDGGQRCKKGTRCDKITGYCETAKVKSKKAVKRKTKRKQSSILRSKRKKDSKLDIMRINETYEELGITEKDYFEDICLVLRNIRKKLHDPNNPNIEWSKNQILKLHELSPQVTNKQGKELKGNKIENRDLYLGPHLIRATDILGKGGFGRIYKGTFGHKNCAIKQSLEPMHTSSSIIDYYTEIIIQNELFCHAHRQVLSQPKYAKIPKPYFMARLNTTPLLGMEPLDDSLYKFIKNTRSYNVQSQHNHKIKMTRVITDMFECICNTLILLQDQYEFYHRDMHAGNIMYRKQGESYQWFLIDFGFSTFKMNNYRFNWEGAGPYGRFNNKAIKEGKAKGRVGHDLRLTLLFIFVLVEYEFSTMLLPEAFDILNMLYRNIRKSILDNSIGSSSNFWHRGYREAFDKLVTRETEPKVFLAETIPRLRAAITKEKGVSSVRHSSRKLKKEYVRVDRKEGKLQTKRSNS